MIFRDQIGSNTVDQSMTTKSSWEKLGADSHDDADDLMAADGTSTMTVVDPAAFDCGVCYLPFKPPIFQCIEGHAVCSTCCEELLAAGKTRCYMCRVPLAGRGYTRCHSLERMVESVRVPCPYAAHGCTARVTYYDRSSHARECPHAPYSCSGDGRGLLFGSVGALLDRVSSAHEQELSRLTERLKQLTVTADIGIELDPRDIDIIMKQASVSMDEAVKALVEAGGDIVKAIMDLTND